MIDRALPACLLGLVFLAHGGCATTVQPPPSNADAVRVYLTDYGRHSSLLIYTSEQVFNEYAFGDWDWFALGQTKPGDAVRAMLFSRASTLGRRQIRLAPDAPAGIVARLIGAKHAVWFKVPRARAEGLVQRLDSLFERYRNTMTYNVDSDMWFVRYDGGYWGCYNCNHLTRSWLESLGCAVRGPALTSDFVLKPSDCAGNDAHDACSPAR